MDDQNIPDTDTRALDAISYRLDPKPDFFGEEVQVIDEPRRVVAEVNDEIGYWDIRTGQLVATQDPEALTGWSGADHYFMRITPGGRLLLLEVLVEHDGLVDHNGDPVAVGTYVVAIEVRDATVRSHFRVGDRNSMASWSVSPSGQFFASSASTGGCLSIRDLFTGETVCQWQEYTPRASNDFRGPIAFDPSGKYLLSGCYATEPALARIWDPYTGTLLETVGEEHPEPSGAVVEALVWSKSDDAFALVVKDEPILILARSVQETRYHPEAILPAVSSAFGYNSSAGHFQLQFIDDGDGEWLGYSDFDGRFQLAPVPRFPRPESDIQNHILLETVALKINGYTIRPIDHPLRFDTDEAGEYLVIATDQEARIVPLWWEWLRRSTVMVDLLEPPLNREPGSGEDEGGARPAAAPPLDQKIASTGRGSHNQRRRDLH